MALPNEHQLTFNQYIDAKTLFEAIQLRFDGNDATKKTHKTLLKQTYENFNASSSESLDSIFNRLQKIISQLSILGVNTSQEDLNLKFLRSLLAEWNTHVVNGAFVSAPGCTNEDTAYIQVSIASTPVSAASTNDSVASLSDATIYAFLANQPSGSQIVHKDLEQIHDDDLEEMDLKWQLALLSMRAKKFYQRTGKKITINGGDTAGFDKTKVECFNYHKLGHFARECRNPRSQESNRPRSYDQGSNSQDNTKRTVRVEDTSSKAMVATDGAGFDWSYMAEEEVLTNMALMAFSDSEVYNNKTCSNTCLKSFETLKTQYDNLRIELNKSEFDLANYKRGLASVEEQLVFYKKNEVIFTDQIAVLKRDASFNESEIIALKILIEKLKKDKEDNLIKIDNYENASKSLDKLIGGQLIDNNRKGIGYNAVPPPPTGLFAPPPVDLSNSGLEEYKQPEFEGYRPKANKSVCVYVTKEVVKTSDAPIIEDWVSDCDEDKIVLKSDNVQQKPKQANQPRNVSQNPRKVQISTARQSSSRAAVPISTARQSVAAPVSAANLLILLHQNPLNLKNKVNTVKANSINTDKTKEVKSAVRKQGFNAVKPSACWVWRPKSNVIDHGDPQIALKDIGIFDSGCSRHMTGNKSYLTDYQDYDRGFVAFAGSSRGGKITRKGKIRTANLDFEDVYFVKELKFNLFSVSQMCDKKTSILFTKTECLILSPEFKLPDENQVMLKIPRKDNITTIVSFMRPFGCLVTILNTLDHLGKFDGKADEGVLVGYSINSKDFRVYNHRTRIVEENLHVNFIENKPNAEAEKDKVPDQEYIILPLIHISSYVPSSPKEDVSSPSDDADKKTEQEPAKEEDQTLKDASNQMLNQEKEDTEHSNDARRQFEAECNEQLFQGLDTRTSSTNNFNIVNNLIYTASSSRTVYPAGPSSGPPLVSFDGSLPIDVHDYPDDPLMPDLEDTVEPQGPSIFGRAYDDDDFYNSFFDDQDVGAEADFNNMEPSIIVSPIPTTRIHYIHPKAQIIGDPNWVEAMHEELLQFKLLNVWTLVDLPEGKKAIGTQWVYKNKKDQRGVVIRNKARLVAQGHRQEEGIDYDEVFAPVARIEAIRLFLAYASYMDFTVYQIDVKCAFLYGTIEEVVYVNQPPGFVDPEFPNKVYKVEKALYGLHQAHRAWYKTLSTYLLENGFRRGIIDKTLFIKKIKNDILLVQMSSMGELTFFLGLQVEQRKDGIFLSQDKYVYDILKKFGFSSVKTASTPAETHKSLATNAAQPDVDVHLYLKGQPTLGLWYPKDSPLDLIAYSDSDYAGANIDKKSTTGGCQFLGCRLISWQYSYEKKLIEMVKIHIDNNVADLLTKAFNVTRFKFLIASIALAIPRQMKIGKESSNLFMAGSLPKTISPMIYLSQEHNMVAYLEKSKGSEGFEQIIDFLSASHIKHALTENPTIYTSHIEQFWRTAALCTVEDEVQGIFGT
ncbi:putative ribonuclease H-like domain-containing protein, partial [Tanacetum coccineum]